MSPWPCCPLEQPALAWYPLGMLILEMAALVFNPHPRRAVVAIAWVSFQGAEMVILIHAGDTAIGAMCGLACQAKEYARATRAARN